MIVWFSIARRGTFEKGRSAGAGDIFIREGLGKHKKCPGESTSFRGRYFTLLLSKGI